MSKSLFRAVSLAIALVLAPLHAGQAASVAGLPQFGTPAELVEPAELDVPAITWPHCYKAICPPICTAGPILCPPICGVAPI